METSGKILMVSGGGLAVLVAGLVSLLLARQPAMTSVTQSPLVGAASTAPQAVALSSVLIAVQPVPSGALIRASDVSRLFRLVYEPSGSVPAQTVFSSPGQLSALLSAVPRRTTSAIAPGQQITAPLFTGMALPSQPSSLSVRLARGFDGETVSIPTPVNAVDGAIGVNDRVDVIYSVPGAKGAQSGPSYTGILIHGATVVAASPLSATYTLALSPGDAVRLAHVKDAGWSIQLVLRSVYDSSAVTPSAAVHRSRHVTSQGRRTRSSHSYRMRTLQGHAAHKVATTRSASHAGTL